MSEIASATADVPVAMTVNGERVDRLVPARRLLSDFIRDDLDLTGTHVGCEQGVCGACTVLIDGVPARSCITLAVQADGRDVTTIEGITPTDGLTPMQEAFRLNHALQCGYCTPGILVTLSAVEPADYPTSEHIRELLAGNICRCTGYQNIVDAIEAAWGRRSGQSPAH